MALSTGPVPAKRLSPLIAAGNLGYFRESRQPIYSALLVLPFLLVYEVGLVVLRSDVINGGQAILKQMGAPIVKTLGVSGSLISLVLLVAAFLFWQFWRQGTWKVQWPVLTFMFFESLMYAVVLFMILRAFVHYAGDDNPIPIRRHTMIKESSPQAFARSSERSEPSPFPSPPGRGPTSGSIARGVRASRDITSEPENIPARLVPCATRSNGDSGTELRDFVLYCGAGVYEELVFRVMLLGVLILVLTRLVHMEHAYAAAWSVAIGAIIFAAYHHIGESGDKFELNVFLQRLLCGLYFSALYYNRSFGMAAASHAMYDILVGLNRIGS